MEDAVDESEGVVDIAIGILDGNVDRIDWRDSTQPELLRKLCEHLEAWDETVEALDEAQVWIRTHPPVISSEFHSLVPDAEACGCACHTAWRKAGGLKRRSV